MREYGKLGYHFIYQIDDFEYISKLFHNFAILYVSKNNWSIDSSIKILESEIESNLVDLKKLEELFVVYEVNNFVFNITYTKSLTEIYFGFWPPLIINDNLNYILIELYKNCLITFYGFELDVNLKKDINILQECLIKDYTYYPFYILESNSVFLQKQSNINDDKQKEKVLNSFLIFPRIL